MKKLIFLFCFLSLTPIILAQTSEQPVDWDTLLDDYQGQKLNLPNNVSVHLEPEIVVGRIDGLISKELYLRSREIQFRSIVLKNWQSVAPNTKNASSYSVSFANRYEPELRIGLKLFKKSQIPAGFNEESMLAFYAGLKAEYISRDVRFLMPPGVFAGTGYFSSLFHNPTFKIDMTFEKAADPRVTLREISYYFSVEDYAVVASIEGPEALVDLNKGTLDSFLQNLSVHQPE